MRDAIAVARAVVDRRTGLFQRFHALPRDADDAGVREVVGAPAAHAILPGGGEIGAPGGRGVGINDAWPCALFEAIERYCPAFVDDARLVFRAAGDDPRFLCGPALPRFSAAQHATFGFPFCAVGGDQPLHWVEGSSLVDGAPRFVPAPLVYMPWRPRTRAELVGPNMSTGTACGPTWTWACLTGLLEVCERDAFAIAWFARLSMPRLVPRPGTRIAARVAAMLAPTARVDFVDLTTDLGAPVVLAVHRQPLRGRPIVTVGAAACASRARAATKALFEAARQYTRIRELAGPHGAPWRPRPDFADVVEFEHHSLVYADPDLQPHLAFLTASPIELPLADDDDAPRDAAFLRRLVGAVVAAGEDVVAVELTTRDVAELGLRVVKVLVPGAAQLAADHRFPLLGSRRLDLVPARLGLGSVAPSQLNVAVPHPFA